MKKELYKELYMAPSHQYCLLKAELRAWLEKEHLFDIEPGSYRPWSVFELTDEQYLIFKLKFL